MPVKNRFAQMLPEVIGWRQDFHAHPELLFEVHRTAARVADLCRSFGCDSVTTGIGHTGVVATIKGRTDSTGRAIALRADMDALPIHEVTGLPYASTTPGRMHACGHDGHMAMLLAAAKYLAETRNFDGTAVLIFQPAEEGGGGGREMCADGLMARWGVAEVYGLHNMPGLPVGQFGIRTGAMMAAADQFEITVTGKGGHAAKPQDCIDTTLVAAHIVVALQSIAARGVDPMAQVVLSVCTVTTDSTAYNVIPQVVRMKGTVRTMDPGVQDFVQARLSELVSGTATAFGARAEVAYQRGYPVTVNPADQAGFAADVAEAVSGQVDRATAPLMAAEDFSYMLNECPGAYIFLGNGATEMLHNPGYVFDDAAIPYGASWYVGMIEARMPAA